MQHHVLFLLPHIILCSQYEIVYYMLKCIWLSKCLTSPDLRNKAILFSFSFVYCSDALFNSAYFCCLFSCMCVLFLFCRNVVFYGSFVSELCDKCTRLSANSNLLTEGKQCWLWFCLVILIEWNHHTDYYFDHDVCFVNKHRSLSLFLCFFHFFSIYNTRLIFVNLLHSIYPYRNKTSNRITHNIRTFQEKAFKLL